MNVELVFETSWEVCNKVGGIHTVISTKALNLVNEFGDNYILIGPDVWREDITNPEFIPDDTLFVEWKIRATNDGLRVKTGRWNIAGKPVVFLIDFTPYFGQQNEIFAKFWETYNLDSITGQWDYVEPALFGYAAGKVIESFTSFFREHHNIIAQFHEWMTGTGILYIEKYTVEYKRSADSIGAPPIESDTRYTTIVIVPPAATGTSTVEVSSILVDLLRKDKYASDVTSGQYGYGTSYINKVSLLTPE